MGESCARIMQDGAFSSRRNNYIFSPRGVCASIYTFINRRAAISISRRLNSPNMRHWGWCVSRGSRRERERRTFVFDGGDKRGDDLLFKHQAPHQLWHHILDEFLGADLPAAHHRSRLCARCVRSIFFSLSSGAAKRWWREHALSLLQSVRWLKFMEITRVVCAFRLSATCTASGSLSAESATCFERGCARNIIFGVNKTHNTHYNCLIWWWGFGFDFLIMIYQKMFWAFQNLLRIECKFWPK